MTKKTKKNSVKDVLKQISEKELRKFVAKELEIQEVLDDFMSDFKDYFLQGDSSEAYINQIDSAFIDAEEDYGYINFSQQSKLLGVVSEAVEAAASFREKGNYEAAIDICFTILENGIEAINHSDDSMGYLGSIMDEGMQALYTLADSDVCTLDEDGRWTFMDRCWTCIEENTFEGWDWHTEMYDFLISLANDDEEYENIMESLDKDECFKSDYRKREQLQMKRRLLEKWKGTEAAHEMMLNNLQIREFREKAIEEAMAADDIQCAYKLALGGIEQDKKERPGIIPTWNHWMLRIAQKENNYDTIVKYASLLYLHPWQEQGDFYKLLRETVSPDKWPKFAEGLARQAIEMNYRSKYADLCSREKWYDKLMEYVRQEKSINTLRQYESQLLRNYRDEIVGMYISYVNKIMANSYTRNRNTYQEICRYLQHAVKLGGHNQVEETIQVLKIKYKRCRALMEELDYIKL